MSVPPPFDAGPVAVHTSRDVIRATGPDAQVYLHGQLSQDIDALQDGESAWSFVLQPQGKVDAWLRVTRIADEAFLLDVDAGFGEATLARLNRFKLRTKCDLNSERWPMIAIRGDGSSGLVFETDPGNEFLVPSAWPGVDGLDMLGAAVSMPSGVAQATEDDLEVLRVMAGVPAMGAELTEATIPAEAGVVDLSVSFTKGCFTGQELVARIDSRGGNVPRRLRGIRSAQPLSVGQAVLIEDTEVGTITSAAGSAGLAYIKRSVEALPAECVVGGAAATVEELPLF